MKLVTGLVDDIRNEINFRDNVDTFIENYPSFYLKQGDHHTSLNISNDNTVIDSGANSFTYQRSTVFGTHSIFVDNLNSVQFNGIHFYSLSDDSPLFTIDGKHSVIDNSNSVLNNTATIEFTNCYFKNNHSCDTLISNNSNASIIFRNCYFENLHKSSTISIIESHSGKLTIDNSTMINHSNGVVINVQGDSILHITHSHIYNFSNDNNVLPLISLWNNIQNESHKITFSSLQFNNTNKGTNKYCIQNNSQGENCSVIITHSNLSSYNKGLQSINHYMIRNVTGNCFVYKAYNTSFGSLASIVNDNIVEISIANN